MGREPRHQCESNVYHVYSRGVSGHTLFEDDNDYRKLLFIIGDALDSYGGELYAYCLMSNHFHLVIHHTMEAVSKIMAVAKARYSRYFNRKYTRFGPLYASRFGCKPVDSDEYFATVIRYVHLNPVAGGLSPTCNYRWSSFTQYFGLAKNLSHSTKDQTLLPVNTEPVIQTFGTIDSLLGAHREGEKQVRTTSRPGPLLDSMLEDAAIIGTIRKELGQNVLTILDNAAKPTRNHILREIKRLGFSNRQVARITGIGYSIVANA